LPELDAISSDGTCDWAQNSELERYYHDTEWGLPSYDDTYLFEFLTLEGAQAGLSWLTILKKREGYRNAFLNFDIQQLAKLEQDNVPFIIENFDVVKHKGKIASVYTNARAALALQQEFGSLSAALWQFVGHQPQINRWQDKSQVPAVTSQSKAMSLFLKKRGFKFVGETICYAFMQAVGMIDDHLNSCPCKKV
jgi:DNA-3-methyladenine glycosylase I